MICDVASPISIPYQICVLAVIFIDIPFSTYLNSAAQAIDISQNISLANDRKGANYVVSQLDDGNHFPKWTVMKPPLCS